MTSDPHISVLIPAYNEEEWIANAIGSVHRSFAALSDLSYEIIVCDNHSSDATAEIARAGGAQVVFEPHNQIARARNAAARAAKGKWLIFMDADTLLNAGTLGETIKGLGSGAVGAGGAVVRMDSEDFPRFLRVLLVIWNGISVVFKLAAGSYIYCHREAWSETGGFDERVYVSEEIWFSIKLKAWCRKKRLKFQIITKAPMVTSARKLKWYTPWQGIRQLLFLAWPRATMERSNCAFWYVRPENSRVKRE